MDSEDHQIAISDYYYSWGWESKDDPKVRVLPSPKLRNISNILTKQNDGLITLIFNITQRYPSISFSFQFTVFWSKP